MIIIIRNAKPASKELYQFCIQACEELHDQVAIGIASDIFLCIYADNDGTAAFAVTDANTPSSAVGIIAPTVLHFTEK